MTSFQCELSDHLTFKGFPASVLILSSLSFDNPSEQHAFQTLRFVASVYWSLLVGYTLESQVNVSLPSTPRPFAHPRISCSWVHTVENSTWRNSEMARLKNCRPPSISFPQVLQHVYVAFFSSLAANLINDPLVYPCRLGNLRLLNHFP